MEIWDYQSVIGVLNYLQAITQPEISYAVHQVSRFCNSPMKSHEQAVKRICHYLKKTQEKGMIFKPDIEDGFKCYVDAD